MMTVGGMKCMETKKCKSEKTYIFLLLYLKSTISALGKSLLLKTKVLLDTFFALKLLTLIVLQELPCLILMTEGT